MIKQMVTALGFAMFASAAPAQSLVFDMTRTDNCMAQNPRNPSMCIGESVLDCMDRTPGGDSTIGQSGCINAEYEAWDRRLNAVYRHLMKLEKAADIEFADIPYARKKAPLLKKMQRAWIVVRDDKCNYEVAQWMGGTGGGGAFANCLMQETGLQTLYLQSMITNYHQ
jgi:uncharacterized protein YecT (DUF1311 family)